jgi:hypothetical protein
MPKLTKAQNKLIETVKGGLKRGCRLVNFTHTAKESKCKANYTVLLGIDLLKAYKRDRSVLCGKMAHLRGATKKQAAQELLDSLNDSIKNGIGNNKRYTCKFAYKRVAKAIKLVIKDGSLIIFGFILNKKVIVEGDYPDRKSSKLTIEKNKLRKLFKCKRFCLFSLSNIHSARIDGKTIILQNKD